MRGKQSHHFDLVIQSSGLESLSTFRSLFYSLEETGFTSSVYKMFIIKRIKRDNLQTGRKQCFVEYVCELVFSLFQTFPRAHNERSDCSFTSDSETVSQDVHSTVHVTAGKDGTCRPNRRLSVRPDEGKILYLNSVRKIINVKKTQTTKLWESNVGSPLLTMTASHKWLKSTFLLTSTLWIHTFHLVSQNVDFVWLVS